MIEKHIETLGKPVQDKVTGLSGIVTSVSFDLYGCVQAVITPYADGSKLNDSMWLDVTRLKITSEERVMDLPDYSKGYIAEGRKGCAEKPLK